MIDEKKIEEAAFESLRKDINVLRHNIGNAYIEGFHAGVNWFLDNLWHDASEEPITTSKENEYVECLVKFKDGFVNLYNYDTWHRWWVCDSDNEVFLGKISRWLYLDDLLKGGK